MSKRIIVENDKVAGTDKHNIAGVQNTGSPPPVYVGIGDYDYVGKMTDDPSDFVKIDGIRVSLKTSKSSLNPGEASSGKHSGPNGRKFTGPAPAPASLKITDVSIGQGKPGGSAGSSFVKIGGTAVLLDGDKIDTCDGTSKTGNSTVTAENQDFVSCSE